MLKNHSKQRNVARRLKRAFDESGLTLVQLAEATHSSIGCLSMILNGQRRPTESVTTRAARVLGVEIKGL